MSPTRLLVLGCLRIFQPAHAYAVARELRSWNAEQWSGLNYGSIYHSLRQMTKEGFLEIVDPSTATKAGSVPGPGRDGRTTYRLTTFGEDEFYRLLREQAWATDVPLDPFAVVLCFAEALPPEEMRRILDFRAHWARTAAEDLSEKVDRFAISTQPADGRPWIVPEQFRLTAGTLRAVSDWAAALAERYERGDIEFTDPSATGSPPPPT